MFIYINGDYEQVNDIDDVVKICRVYINDEFADKVQEMYEEIENKKELINDIYQQLKEGYECIERAMSNLEDI